VQRDSCQRWAWVVRNVWAVLWPVVTHVYLWHWSSRRRLSEDICRYFCLAVFAVGLSCADSYEYSHVTILPFLLTQHICGPLLSCILLMSLLMMLPSVLWHCWLGIRKSIWPVKIWVMTCWRGCLSGARCRLFAWSSWCYCFPNPRHLMLHLNPDWFYLSGIGLPRLSRKKRPLNGCSSSSSIRSSGSNDDADDD